MEIIQRKKDSLDKYKEYIDNHIQCVQNAFAIFGKDLSRIIHSKRGHNEITLEDTMKQVELNVKVHDKSKYDIEESAPYAAKFFPWKENQSDTFTINKQFNVAWTHHYKINKHHPEYWKVHSKSEPFDSKEIPNVFFIEMICDWVGVSMVYKSSVYDWWFNRPNGRLQKKKILNENDLSLCDEIIIHYKNDFNFEKK